MGSQTGAPSRVDVDEYPVDESPHGLRGGSGQQPRLVRATCGRAAEPADRRGAGSASEPAPDDGDAYPRRPRGRPGAPVENHCRVAGRFVGRPDHRTATAGIRVARAYP